jgi:hypothetical protein
LLSCQDKRRERIRDRERKERKFPEKVSEKEAKGGGGKGIVTYSKSGGATRWSANSTPFKKGKDDIQVATFLLLCNNWDYF